MATISEIRHRITARDETKDAIRSARAGISGLRSSYGSLVKSVAGVAAAYVTWRAATAFIKGAIDAANTQELAERRLAQSLGYTSTALLQQASALQKVTRYGDEAIIEAQSLIAAFVKDEAQIKAATRATLDLAAAKGMDLTAAADLVSKTLGSSTNALSRYGIQVEGAVGSTERLDSLTRNIAGLFGGQAAAQADIFGGRVQQLTNAFGDLMEEVGFAFTKNRDFNSGIVDLTQSLYDLQPTIRAVVSGVSSMTTATAKFLHLFTQEAQDDNSLAIARDRLKEINGQMDVYHSQVMKLQRTYLSEQEMNDLLIERGALLQEISFLENKYRKKAGQGSGAGGAAGGGGNAAAQASAEAQARREAEAEVNRAYDEYEFNRHQAQLTAISQVNAANDAYEFQRRQEQQAAINEVNRANDAYEFNRRQQQAEAIAEVERANLEARYAEEQRIEEAKKQLRQQGFAIASQTMYALYQASGKQNKKMFEAYKLFATADAIISTYHAAALALANPPGPPWSLAYVALAIANGMAQVRAIQSQQFGGGAAVSPKGAGGSYNPVTPTTPAQGINAAAGREITVRIISDVAPSDDLKQTIKTEIVDDVKDGRINWQSEKG